MLRVRYSIRYRLKACGSNCCEYVAADNIGIIQVFPEAEAHRAEADHQAKLRAAKLAESQRAYQAGQKANAHELSVEVRSPGRDIASVVSHDLAYSIAEDCTAL